MSTVQFFGPVRVYVRRSGPDWEAWADPFSVVGEGRTREAAVESAKRNVEDYISAAAEAIHRHGNRVDLITPLPPDLKGDDCIEFLLYACRDIRRPTRHRSRLQTLDKRSLRGLLREGADVGIVPAPVGE